MIKIIKNQTPIDCDAHFKYVCPNPKCSIQHWQSLQQVRVKNYKIVCDCGFVIKPKQIKSIKIEYIDDNQDKEVKNKQVSQKSTQEIPHDILEKSSKILINYGFTKEEATLMIKDAYDKNPTIECSILVKQTLESFGANNVNTNSSV